MNNQDKQKTDRPSKNQEYEHQKISPISQEEINIAITNQESYELNLQKSQNQIKIPKEEENGDENTKNKEDDLFKSLALPFKDVSIFRIILHLSTPMEIFLLILALIGTIATGTNTAFQSLFLGDTINQFSILSDPNSINNKKIFEDLEPKINKLCYEFLIIFACLFVGYFLMMSLWTYTALRQIHRLKYKYFSVIFKQEQGWFDQINPYEFNTKVQSQLEQIEAGLGEKFGQIFLMLSQVISGLIVGFLRSWKASLLLLTTAPLNIISVGVMDYFTSDIMNKSRKTYEEAGGIAEELIYNIKTVASFTNFDYEIERFNKLIHKVYKYDRKSMAFIGISMALSVVIFNLGYFVAYIYSRSQIVKHLEGKNDFQAGDTLVVMFSVLCATMSLGFIAPNLKLTKLASIASSDYFSLLERKNKIYISEKDLKPEKEKIKGKIEFRNIDFTYPSDKDKRKTLKNLSFIIEPGQKVAFCGESGCGKSTTVNLLERLYMPDSGQILLDDIDINDYNLEYLRSLMGYVQQEPILFNTSIKENIIFGRENELSLKGYDISQLLESAVQDSYINEFIEKTKEKLEYIVGIKGSKLSGGQKQRVAIARALLAKPIVLILDEATSALDNKSEKEVQKVIDNLSKKNTTTIIIAHRLSTIKNSDVIFALKDGEIKEKGTHEQLLKLNGYYAGLFKSQLTEDEFQSKEENYINKICKNSDRKNSTISDERHFDSTENNSFGENQKLTYKNSEKSNASYSEIFSFIKDKKCLIFLGLLSSFTYGALCPISGIFHGKLTNALSLTEIDEVKKQTLLWSLLFIVLALSNSTILFIKIYSLDGIGTFLSEKARRAIFKKYLELDVEFYDYEGNTPGSLLTRLSIDTIQMSNIIMSVLGAISGTAGSLIIGLILCLYYDWKLGLIQLAFLPITVSGALLEMDYMENGKKINKQIQIESGNVLSECLINTKTIFSYNFNEKALEMYKNILQPEKKTYLKSSIIKGILMGIGVFANYGCKAITFKCGFSFIKRNKLTYENFLLLFDISYNIGFGIIDSLRGVTSYKKAKLSLRSIYNTLTLKSDIKSFKEGNTGKILPDNLIGKIEFKNVTFAYPTKPYQNVIKDLSFVIEPNKSYGLVGYSGSGKSTIIQLIERFYDINEGQILIDDINIKDYNLYELRKKIGLVSQEPILFKRNIYQNILYGNLNADKNKVIEAAKRAKIEKFLNNDDEGTKEDPVSGGEKQRICIARAFLKDPVILLLDEATSSLDKETEKEVMKSIVDLQKGRTSITVAHRLNTVENCDQIFVLESGKIIEKGNHSELLLMNGKYANLYRNSYN